MKQRIILSFALCMASLPCYADYNIDARQLLFTMILVGLTLILSIVVMLTVSLKSKWIISINFSNLLLQGLRLLISSDFDQRLVEDLVNKSRGIDMMRLTMVSLLYLSLAISIVKVFKFFRHTLLTGDKNA